jgi:ring-1,2-phenylacetyl-CoA epoxidase subunit PaaD
MPVMRASPSNGVTQAIASAGALTDQSASDSSRDEVVAAGAETATGNPGGLRAQGPAAVGSDGSSPSGSEPDELRDRERRVWEVLEAVPDPEIPVLTVVDLGIVRHVRWLKGSDGRDELHVGITPTYSGCPATEVIRGMIAAALECKGYAGVVIEEVLSPPWTSDWLTEAGRRKLQVFGIAPPEHGVSSPRHLFRTSVVACPRCGSHSTEKVSEFGSTPCKAHYRCTSCLEPFDYFKCI